MENCQNWYHLCLYIVGAFTLLFMMLLGYNLKWRKQQIELVKRTEQLEKKNGKELKRIKEVEQKNEGLQERVKELENIAEKYEKNCKNYAKKQQ